MKRSETTFITDLLSDPKLTANQKNKVFELALRDIDKNGSEERILKELNLIKEKMGMGIETRRQTDEDGRILINENGNWKSPVTEEDMKDWKEVSEVDEEVSQSQEENSDQDRLETWTLPKITDEQKDFIKKYLNEKEINRIERKKNKPTANPKHVADFMSLFNQREGLKYLTHDYDDNNAFEIDEFLIKANKVFIEKSQDLKIPPSLWRLIKQFAFDSDQTEWTTISEDYKKSIPVRIGWATPELRDWSKQSRLHPIRNIKYKNIIDDFKRITRIEYSNFEKLVDVTLNNVFQKDLNSFEMQKIDLARADFYSHVNFLKIALETIFEEIKKRSNSPDKKKFSIQYDRPISEESYYIRKIIITHYNSFPNKELELILKEWQEKGNMGKIKEKLEGYCHWSIETLIEGKPSRVNILREKDTNEYEKIDHYPEGFTHILTFYYK